MAQWATLEELDAAARERHGGSVEHNYMIMVKTELHNEAMTETLFRRISKERVRRE